MEDIHLQTATNTLEQASSEIIRLVNEETKWEQVKVTKSIRVFRLIHEGPCITKTFMSINKPINQIFQFF